MFELWKTTRQSYDATSTVSLSSSVPKCTIVSDEERAVPSVPFGGVTVNKSPLPIHYTVCTFGRSNAQLIT